MILGLFAIATVMLSEFASPIEGWKLWFQILVRPEP